MLTANRTSVKVILRELKVARIAGRLGGVPSGGVENNAERQDEVLNDYNSAAIWVVDARSLAEGMSGQQYVLKEGGMSVAFCKGHIALIFVSTNGSIPTDEFLQLATKY